MVSNGTDRKEDTISDRKPVHNLSKQLIKWSLSVCITIYSRIRQVIT